MHFSGRGLVHFELIDPATGAPVPLADGAEGELVYTHLAPARPRRSSASAAATMSGCGPAAAPAAAPRRASAASAAPTTC